MTTETRSEQTRDDMGSKDAGILPLRGAKTMEGSPGKEALGAVFLTAAAFGCGGSQPTQPQPLASPAIPPEGYVRLAFNESPFGPPPCTQTAMEEMLSRPYAMDTADPDFMPGINRYPDFLNVTVSNRIAARHGISSGQVIACCGFSELAYMCSQAFLPTGKHLLMPELTYRLPAFYAQQCGKGVHTARMDSAHGIDLMAMLEEVDPDTGLIYLANPNNPTGSLLALDDLESFLSLAARKSPEAVFLIDEAYVDYVQQSPAPEAIPLCTRFRAVVGRTFSKAFGLAGLRAGYAIAGSELGLELSGFLSGYLGGDTGWRMFEGNINRLAESAALASLSGEGLAFVESVRTRNADLRDLLDRGLRGFGFDPLPSHANFMLVEVKSRGENLRRCLFGRKILVQAGESFHSSLRNWIRVSVGSRDEIDAFLEALAAYDPARAYPECLPVFYHGI